MAGFSVRESHSLKIYDSKYPKDRVTVKRVLPFRLLTDLGRLEIMKDRRVQRYTIPLYM